MKNIITTILILFSLTCFSQVGMIDNFPNGLNVTGITTTVVNLHATGNITSDGSIGVSDHNDLANKQGGTTNEYYHITSAQSSNLIANKTIFNPSPSDSTASGMVITDTAGTALKFHDVCYIGTDGRMEKADANTDGHIPMFLCIDVIADGSTGLFLTEGFVCEVEDFEFANIGVPVYLSETAGALTVTKPTTASCNIWIIGITTHKDRFYFKPSLNWVKLAP